MLQLARAIVLRHRLCGLILTQETPEGANQTSDTPLGDVNVSHSEHLIDARDDLRKRALRRYLPAVEFTVEARKIHSLAAALSEGMILIDGGGYQLYAGELDYLEVGVIVLVPFHMQVAR